MNIKDLPYYYRKDGVDRTLIKGAAFTLPASATKGFDLTPGVLNPIKTYNHLGIPVGTGIDGNLSSFSTQKDITAYKVNGSAINFPEDSFLNVINIKDKEGKIISKVHTKFDRRKDLIADIPEFKAFMLENGYSQTILDKYELKHFGLINTHAYLSHGLQTKEAGLAMSFTKNDRNEILDLVASCYTGPAQIRMLSSYFRSLREAIKVYKKPTGDTASDHAKALSFVNQKLFTLLKETEPSNYNYMDFYGRDGMVGTQTTSGASLLITALKNGVPFSSNRVTYSTTSEPTAYGHFLTIHGLLNLVYNIDEDKWIVTTKSAIGIAVAIEMGFEDKNLTNELEDYTSNILGYRGRTPHYPGAYRIDTYALPGIKTSISRSGNLYPVLAGFEMTNLIDSSTSANVVYESLDNNSFTTVQAYLMMTHENKPLIVLEQDFVVDVIYGSVLTNDFLTVMEEGDVNAISNANEKATAIKSIQQFRNITSKYPRSSFAVVRYCNKGLYEAYRNPDFINIATAASEWTLANGKDFNEMTFHMDEASEVTLYTAKKRYQTLYNKATVDKNFLFQQKMSYFRTGEQGARAVIDPNGNFVPIILISGLVFDSFVSTVDGIKTIDHGNVVVSSDMPLFRFDTDDIKVGFSAGNVFTEIVAFDERFNIYESLKTYNYMYTSASSGKSVFTKLTEQVLAAKANAAISEAQRNKMLNSDYWNFGNGSIGTVSVLSQGWKIDENDIIRLVKANKYLVQKGIPTLNDGDVNSLFVEFGADTDDKKGIVLTALMMKLDYQKIIDLINNLTELFSHKAYEEANPAWPYMWSYQLDGNGTTNSIKEDLLSDGFTAAEIATVYPELMTDLESKHFALEERYFGGYPTKALTSVVENSIFTTKIACEKTASLSDSLCGFLLPFIVKYKN